MTITLIGLAGRAGAGKDTAADYLCAHHGFVRYAFADPLRAMLRVGLGLSDAHLSDRLLKEQPVEPYGISPRKMMQTLGTEWGRQHVHPDLWLLAAGKVLTDIEDNDPRARVVITDLRFDNEAEWVRRQGGTVVHIERAQAGAVAHHVSEGGVRAGPTDWLVANESSIDQLNTALASVVRCLCREAT